MLKNLRTLLLVGATVVLAACGGGGDDGDSTPNFAGNYQISVLTLSSNSCGGSPTPSSAGGFDTVVQNGRNVTASNGAISGTIDGDNGGFTFTKTEVRNGVTVVTTFKFRATSAGASTFNVTLTSTGTLGSTSCAIGYTGTATKL